MSDRIMIEEDDLNNVVGGSLLWTREGVYCKENPGKVYSFAGNYAACRLWIQQNWLNKPHDNALLEALAGEGLIHEI